MVKILESKTIEVVEDLKSVPKVDKPKQGQKVIELSLQEEIFSRSTKVEKLPNETFVDLPTEPTLELISPLADLRVSFFLRSPDVYDPLQIFYIRHVHRRLVP